VIIGKPAAICVGIPNEIADFAANYMKEAFFAEELSHHEEFDEADKKDI
jgi:hypothetical protein